MSLLSPPQIPEPQPRPSDYNESSIPCSDRAIDVRPSPMKSFKTLDSGEDENDIQSTVSSGSGPRIPIKQSSYKSIMARLKNNRQRRDARGDRVNRLIGLIEKIQHETYVGRSEVISEQLFPKDYIELLIEVDDRDQDFQRYFHRQLRYEYRESIHGKEQFKILMLSAFYISIQKSIDHGLLCWKDDFVSDKNYSIESRAAAKKIDSIRDQAVDFESNKILRGDCSFIYQEDHYTHPPLIFEIAWSQSTQDLEKRAMELIEEGAGQIRTVVGLDFYETWQIWDTIRDQVGNSLDPKRGPFTAFVWRVAFNKSGQQIFNANNRPRIQKSKFVFCDNDGMANPTERLQLKLRDFVPARVIKAEGWERVKDLDDAKWELDALTMLRYFDDALKKQKLKDENSEPRKQKLKEEISRLKAERAAKRRANAENERRRWDISSLIEIGGHRLRRLPGRG
ncbi:hypothetical protein F5Y09DRAFT_336477 [Xylaria sp. FL1042]|nr:hypothetical protein F5Y09DRAFT_336477 [Xylaria sp. FL1042]